MFKKAIKILSVVAVLLVNASAVDFCETSKNLFLLNGLVKEFYKLNKATPIEKACANGTSPICLGVTRAIEKTANVIFTEAGYEATMSLLNKYGIKKNITKAQITSNYISFFNDYLKNKFKHMSVKEQQMFLEKMYLFFNRATDEIINFNTNNIKEVYHAFFIKDIFKNPLFYFKHKNDKVTKAFITLGAQAYIANQRLNGTDTIEGAAILALHAISNLKYEGLKGRFHRGYLSEDEQLGGSADNLEKFFVYVATKQFDKAYNLVNNTYSDKFIEEFNKDIAEACNITDENKYDYDIE